MIRRLPSLLPILILFLLPVLMFWQQTMGGKTLIPSENLYQYEPYATYRDVVNAPSVPHNHLVSDLVLQNYQWKSFLRQQLAIGEIPLWNPYQFAGIPFLAAGQHSGLYPLSALYYVLELPSAYGWFTVLNLWLAGAFMFGFVRVLGVSRAGALLAGMVYQLCGFVLASVVFQMMIGGIVWLPLMLWMIEWIVRGRRMLMALLVGAIALGLNVLAGHAEITIYTLVISGYYAAGRLLSQVWQTRDWRWMFNRSGWLLAMIVLGLGLGAIQLIPLFDFVRVNWRGERASLDTVLSYAHVPRDFLQFLMPNFYGNPAHHQIFDVFSGNWITLDGSPSFHTDWGIKNYVEAALYVGILPLILAAYALWGSWRRTCEYRAHAVSFGLLGAVSLSFMFGLPTYALIYILPGINQLNSPFRWIYALTVCVAVLAAFGLDKLMNNVGTARVRLMGTGLLAIGGGLLAALVASRVLYPSIASFVERLFTGMEKASSAFPNAQTFYSYQVGNAAILGVVLLLCGVVFAWVGRMKTRGTRAFVAVEVFALVLVAVDLMAASWNFNPASDPELLKFTPPSIQFLQQQGDFRFITLDDPDLRPERPNLQANATWQYGLDDVRGYDSIIPRNYVEYMRGFADQPQLDFNRIAPLYTSYNDFDVREALTSPRLRALNIGFIVTQTNSQAAREVLAEFPDDFTAVHSDPAQTIYRVNDTLPRFYLCCEDEVLRERLASGDILDNDIQAMIDSLSVDLSRVELKSDTGRERLLDVTTIGERWLIVSENYADGWRVFVRPLGTGDNQETLYPVQAVNGIFQGVRLPEGEWTVRLVYSPSSFQVGLFGSLTSVALITLLIGMALWRSFVGTNTVDSSTSARIARNSLAPIILNLFNKGIDFAFLLVMLRLLSPQEVGTYYYLVVVFVWFDIFSNFGLDLFLIRAISRDKTQGGTLFYNTTILRLMLCVVGIALIVGFVVVRQTTVSPPLQPDALLALGLLYAGLFPASLSKGMSSLFYAHEQAEKPAAIATITTINKAVFGVVALLLGTGIVGLAGVSILNNLITLGVLLYTGRTLIGRIATWRPDFTLIRHMMRDSWSLLLNHFLATIFFQIDVILLDAYRGAEIVAKYSISYRWLNAINIIPSFFTQALLPVMARQAHEDLDALKRTYTLGIKIMFMLAMPTAVGFTFLAVPLTTLMGGSQYLPEGAIALILMIWSIPIGWMNSLTQYALVALDLHRALTAAFFTAVAFNIVMNMLFIPQFSYIAAAIITIASELLLFIPFALLMQRGLKTRLNWLALLWRPFLAAGAMAGATFVLWSLGYLALVVGVAVYSAALVALRPLDERERAMFGRMLPSRVAGVARRVGLA